MEWKTEIASYCATIGAEEAKPLEWDSLAEAVNKRNPDQAPISSAECQYVSILFHTLGSILCLDTCLKIQIGRSSRIICTTMGTPITKPTSNHIHL